MSDEKWTDTAKLAAELSGDPKVEGRVLRLRISELEFELADARDESKLFRDQAESMGGEICDLHEENTSLYYLLSDIRAAAGDPSGKLMQKELVEHIASLWDDSEHLDELVPQLEELAKIREDIKWATSSEPHDEHGTPEGKAVLAMHWNLFSGLLSYQDEARQWREVADRLADAHHQTGYTEVPFITEPLAAYEQLKDRAENRD